MDGCKHGRDPEILMFGHQELNEKEAKQKQQLQEDCTNCTILFQIYPNRAPFSPLMRLDVLAQGAKTRGCTLGC